MSDARNTDGIELVIFDLDGVLIDSEAISAQMLVSELSKRGVEIDLQYVARHFLGRSYPVVLSQIREDFGIQLSSEFEDGYRARLLDAFDRDLRIMPGVRTVLDALTVPFCVATSSSPLRVARCLGIVGLTDTFGDHVSTASEVKNGKPAPDLPILAAQRMGVPPAHCLVVEDSLNGILAARAAGMRVWRFIGGSHLGAATPQEPPESIPDRRFLSFADFFQDVPGLARQGRAT